MFEPIGEDMEILIIEVIDSKEKNGCEQEYKKGKRWIIKDNTIPGGFCVGGLSALLPWITCIKYNANIPWENNNEIKICCTDPDHPVTFQIRKEIIDGK